MRAVNLIPPEDRRGERAPLRSGPLAYVVVGVLALAFLGVYALVSTGNTVAEREAAVAALEEDLAAGQARAQALQSFSNFATLEVTRTQTVSDLALSRFDWERVLRELAFVIPADVSLTSLTGAVAGEGGGSGGSASASGAAVSPTMTMAGCVPSQRSVAAMVASLRDIDGVTRVGLTSSTKPGSEGEAEGGAAAPEPAEVEGGCASTQPVVFDLIVYFDGVQVDPASGGVVPPAVPATEATDDGGVGEVERERQQGRDDVDSARNRSEEAVDEILTPGT